MAGMTDLEQMVFANVYAIAWTRGMVARPNGLYCPGNDDAIAEFESDVTRQACELAATAVRALREEAPSLAEGFEGTDAWDVLGPVVSKVGPA